MSRQKELCDKCWMAAVQRWAKDGSKTRTEYYQEIFEEMGSHENGHPAEPVDTDPSPEITQIVLDVDRPYPEYVLIRRGDEGRVYAYAETSGEVIAWATPSGIKILSDRRELGLGGTWSLSVSFERTDTYTVPIGRP